MALSYEATGVVQVELAGGILLVERADALQVAFGLLGQGLVLVQLGSGLVDAGLVDLGVDDEERLSAADIGTLLEEHLFRGSPPPGADLDELLGADASDVFAVNFNVVGSDGLDFDYGIDGVSEVRDGRTTKALRRSARCRRSGSPRSVSRSGERGLRPPCRVQGCDARHGLPAGRFSRRENSMFQSKIPECLPGMFPVQGCKSTNFFSNKRIFRANMMPRTNKSALFTRNRPFRTGLGGSLSLPVHLSFACLSFVPVAAPFSRRPAFLRISPGLLFFGCRSTPAAFQRKKVGKIFGTSLLLLPLH